MMVDDVLTTLMASENEAADDVLLEALAVGRGEERDRVLDALIRRSTQTGVFGLLKMFEKLPGELGREVILRAGEMYHQLSEAGRSADFGLRLAAMKVIALARLGRLSYVLSENLHHPDEGLSGAAADAMVALARYVSSETRRLQAGKVDAVERRDTVRKVLEMRGDIENAVYRALDLHRGDRGGDKGQELLRAALLLCDNAQSKTLSVLSTSRHGGVAPMVKKLQQTPEAEHVDAFLLGATHGQLRQQFAVAFAHIENGPVLDALLRRTHYLKDVRLETCVRQVNRGAWWNERDLSRDIHRRDLEESAKIVDWIASSGVHDVVQDEKLVPMHQVGLSENAAGGVAMRTRLLMALLARPKGSSTTLLLRFAEDPDERLQRIAVRELVRRRPVDTAQMMLGLMKTAPASVRSVAARAVSQSAFEGYFEKFEKLDTATRERAGRAVFKLLPDATLRLGRKMRTGPAEQRLRALTITQELSLADPLREVVLGVFSDGNARLRSKAVAVAGMLNPPMPDAALEKALSDPDARVRANAIEVLESLGRKDYVPMLLKRVQSTDNRERANAVKALANLRVAAATPQLMAMLRDPRPDHRISAMWAARQAGVYQLVGEIVRLAQSEPDPRVRRYAVASVKVVAGKLKELKLARSAAAAPGGIETGTVEAGGVQTGGAGGGVMPPATGPSGVTLRPTRTGLAKVHEAGDLPAVTAETVAFPTLNPAKKKPA